MQTKPKFDQKVAWSHLNKQVEFGPRFPGMEGHTKCRDWILEEMTKNCENVRKQELTHKWSKGKTLTMWNLIGEQNYAKAKNRILLIAHWDTRPFADQDPSSANHTKPILGANDGASGVAVLLELMRVLKDNLPKDTGVMYLMTDGEDVGPELSEMFLGATHFSKNLPEPKPDYGILIDMIGDKDLRVPVEPNSYQFAPKLITALYDHAKAIGLAETFPFVEGPWIEDDHICLNKAGLKTIDLIDFSYEPSQSLLKKWGDCSKLGFKRNLLTNFVIENQL
ncbi:MAG: M28 family peptidase [Fimbriimonadaceae bacterium]